MTGYCDRCGTQIIDGDRFCMGCGAPAADREPGIACPGCGAQNKLGSSVCGACGRPLPATEAYEQNGIICPSCGGESAFGNAYCDLCGRPLPYQSYQAAEPPFVKRRNRNPLILSATALVLAVALVLGLWKPGFLWELKKNISSQIGLHDSEEAIGDPYLEELLNYIPEYNPSEIPVSGTAAFTVSPMEGITISAESNALDQERTFETTPLTESELGELFATSSYGEWLPVFAFDFDAGMSDDQRLPGDLNIDIDMMKFGIEKELWPYVRIMRIADDGSVMELPSVVSDSIVSYRTRQNCVMAITLGLAIGIPFMRFIETRHDKLDELYPNEIWFEAVYSELQSSNAKYRVIYPRSLARIDSQELHDLENRYTALREKYNLDIYMPLVDAALNRAEKLSQNPEYSDTDVYGAAYRLMQSFINDPEHLSIMATFNDPQWQQQNLWPDSVANVCNRLAKADEFLFTEREFRVPSHVINVLVLDKWPHDAETLGISRNLYTESPYILINATNSKVLDLQSLLMTTTHELFHVVQSGYVNFDSNDYMPFWEAAAVLLEKEAFNYYTINQLIDSSNTSLLTMSVQFELLSKSMMMPSTWQGVDSNAINQFMQNQGYVSHYFLEFLKTRYNLGGSFLPDLMSRFAATFSTLDSDVHIVLMNQTSSNKAIYCNDFKLFCIQNYENILNRSMYEEPKPEVQTLSAENNRVECQMPYQSFSTRIRDIAINNKNDKGELQEYRILAVGDAPGSESPTIRFYDYEGFLEQIAGDSMVMLPINTSSKIYVHEIEDYFKTEPGITIGTGYKYELYLMLPPAAPAVEINEDDLVVTIQGFGMADAMRTGYDVVVINPKGEKFQFPQEPFTREVEIPLRELESEREPEDNSEPKYTVYIVEKVELPDGSLQYGPDGEKSDMDDELRFEDILGSWDMTQEVSGFSSSMMDGLTDYMEGIPELEEYMDYYEQYMGSVDGTYNGTMVITEYQTGGQIVEVAFYQTGYEDYGTVYYRGTWNQIGSNQGSLYLEPIGEVLGGSWNLIFNKESGKLSCEGTSVFESDMASYSYTLTATKKS